MSCSSDNSSSNNKSSKLIKYKIWSCSKCNQLPSLELIYKNDTFLNSTQNLLNICKTFIHAYGVSCNLPDANITYLRPEYIKNIYFDYESITHSYITIMLNRDKHVPRGRKGNKKYYPTNRCRLLVYKQ